MKQLFKSRLRESSSRKMLIIALVYLALPAPFARGARVNFSKYKSVLAYEVRPGILMLPSYSAKGHVCEIGLEVLHYSPKVIRMDSSISHKEIIQILDELVPAAERGPKSKSDSQGLAIGGTFSRTTLIEYKNITLEIIDRVKPDIGISEPALNNLVAVIKWKHRKCR